MDYQEKVGIVTGGNSGIGAATALRLAKLGCRLVICGRRKAENERIAEQIRTEYRTDVFSYTGDVSDESVCQGLIEATCERFGRLDFLVNNAGIMPPRVRIAESSTDDLKDAFETNFYSCYWLSREAFRKMETQSIAEDTRLRGAIINIASILGVEAWAGVGIYAASKHAMMGLTRAMAEEGEETGIRVSAVCPALVATPMSGQSGEAYIQPEDIAASVTHLLELSPAAWPVEFVVKRRGAS